VDILKVETPHDVTQRIRIVLDAVEIAHPGLRPFKGLPVMDHAFFPGGNGLYGGQSATRTPFGGTLILGSNFGCTNGFINAQCQLRALDERNNPTWRSLLQLLKSSGIGVDECFFTNAWPFLHDGDSNLTRGRIGRWLRDATLTNSCVPFFRVTLCEMRSRLVIALGTGSAAFLSHVWPESLGEWRRNKIDSWNELPMAHVRLDDRESVCVAITHPSMSPMSNARHRRPPYQYREGEIELLKQAWLESEKLPLRA
jgi:hypothetical protein